MLVSLGGREYEAAPGAIYGLLNNSLDRLQAPGALVTYQALELMTRYERELAIAEIEEHRRSGKTVLLISNDEPLLERLADEVWWLEGSEVKERGAAGVVLERYRAHVARQLREAAEDIEVPLSPSVRRGDGRASVEKVELLGTNDRPTAAWMSGEAATVRVSVQFSHEVADPVIGILIRTRIGLNVYGTNTELEGLHFGPVPAHHAVRLRFTFACQLCPGEYTLTVASHDPDGTWHDWLEDAVAFTVTDHRYTAGVANLRASVSFDQ
jgi:hypothetical protein